MAIAQPAPKRRRAFGAIPAGIALSIACLALPTVGAAQAAQAAQDSKPQERADRSVRLSMHNVKYRFAKNVSAQINYLNGAFVPVGDHEMPVFDDTESFRIRIDSAEIAISPQDVANLLNQFVFARPGSPLSGLSVSTTEKGHLKIKGRLASKGDIPVETEGPLIATPDGKLGLHAEKVKALKIPVGVFGIEIDNLIKSGKVPGLTAEQNDLIIDLEQLLPAPHIDGKVTKIRVEPNTIVQTFASAGAGDTKSANDAKPMAKIQGNYVALQGNKVQFGKLTVEVCDIALLDMDPADPLDFFLDHYKEQVAAGYTKISASFQLRVYVKDYGKLAAGKSVRRRERRANASEEKNPTCGVRAWAP